MIDQMLCPSCQSQPVASITVGDICAKFFHCGSFRLLKIEGNGDPRCTDFRTIYAITSEWCGKNGSAITDEKVAALNLREEGGVVCFGDEWRDISASLDLLATEEDCENGEAPCQL